MKKYGSYDDLVLANGDCLPFKENAFDVSLASEVVEHLHKSRGLLLLQELERVALRRVVVTTPNLWMQQNAPMPNRHLSKWTVSDLRRINYRVHGIGFKVRLFKSELLQAGMDFILFPSWFIPEISKFLVAYKDLSKAESNA